MKCIEMDQQLEQLFLMEINYQCRLALLAHEDLLKALDSRDNFRCWLSVQSILISAGNISKIFWPPPPLNRDPSLKAEYDTRGDSLRKKLSVDNGSVLNSRDVRNHFEHYDTRVHEWAKKSRRHSLSYRSIAPPGAINVGPDPTDYMYNLDPKTLAVTFWEDRFDIPNLIDTICQLQTGIQNSLPFSLS